MRKRAISLFAGLAFSVIFALSLTLAQTEVAYAASDNALIAYSEVVSASYDDVLSDNLFYSSQYYNNDLASACASLCFDVENVAPYFPDRQSEQYTWDLDSRVFHIGIGYKEIEINGSPRNLVVITCSGTGLNQFELFSDFAKDLEHYPWEGQEALFGRYQYAVSIETHLHEFVADHPAVTEHPIVYLVTGYSLGGAAANLMGARLTNTNPGLDRVFVYTFGAIKAIASEANVEGGYHNIFNIYNYYDSFGPHGGYAFLDVSDPFYKFGHTFLCYFDYEEGLPTSLVNHDMGHYRDEVTSNYVNATIDRKAGKLNNDDQRWILSNGMLKLFGTGALNDSGLAVQTASWGKYRDEVNTVVIQDGITKIGENGFSLCKGLETIYIPKSLATIGNYAFFECDSLRDIYYSGTRAEWDAIDVDYSYANEALQNATLHCLGDEQSQSGTSQGGVVDYIVGATRIKKDTVLNHDLEINGNLYIDAGTLYLAGHTVTVYGDVILDGGSLSINNQGTLNANGNLLQESGFVEVYGSLAVGGDYEINIGSGSIYSRVFYVGEGQTATIDGDFKITSDRSKNFELGKDSSLKIAGSLLADTCITGVKSGVITMTGSAAATVKGVEGPSLVVENASGRRVTFAGTLELGDLTGEGLHATAEDLRFGATLQSDVILDGDVTVTGEFSDNGKNLTIKGDLVQDAMRESYPRSFYISGIVNVEGNLTQSRGSMSVGGGKLIVGGNHEIKKVYHSDETRYRLCEGGSETVAGNFTIEPDVSSSYLVAEKNSSLEIGGSLLADTCITGVKSGVITMTGSAAATVKGVEGPSLVVENASGRRVTFAGTLELGDLTGEGLHATAEDLRFGATLQSDVILDGDVTVTGEFSDNGKNLTIKGDLVQDAMRESYPRSFYISGIVNVEGNLTQSRGSMSVGGGKLIVGGNHEIGSVAADGAHAKGGSYLVYEGGEEAVGGDFVSHGTNQSWTYGAGSRHLYSGGKLKVGGSLMSHGTLEGSSDTEVTMTGSGAAIASGISGPSLVVENASGRQVTLAGTLELTNLKSDGPLVASSDLNLSATLMSDLTIDGDMTMQNDLDLNAHTMSIHGNMLHSGGLIRMDGGTLNISGNYQMAVRDESASSGAYLNMTNENDLFAIGGNVLINSKKGSSLTNGLMYIAGDFEQNGSSYSGNFNATGNHKVVLNGSEIQHVTFDSYPSSKFNIVELCQEESQYVFSPNPCWSSIINKDEGNNNTSIGEALIADIPDQLYSGEELTPSLTIKLGDKTLESDTDYTVTYKDNTNVGTATVTVIGKGSYTGTKSETFEIVAANISGATITGLMNQTYNGKARTPAPTVTLDGTILKSGTDYTVAYKDNTNVGAATVTVTGTGNYTGTGNATFAINKAKQPMTVKAIAKKVKAATAKKKAVAVKNAITVKKNQGKISFKNVSKTSKLKKFKVNAKNGTITVPKGIKKGTYKIKVQIAAKGNANYKAGFKTVTVKITVK